MKMFDSFAKGDMTILVSTSLYEVGVDIPGLDLIISFDYPVHEDGYSFRVFNSKWIKLYT
ncbi:MAG: hypothetical protein EOP34_04810 [Rickettsiales bacterium]|nr:MAG: hypothetical protein EOP34_04810 [Rickettsiales bacterium]